MSTGVLALASTGSRHDSTAFAANGLGNLTTNLATFAADTAYGSVGLTTPVTEHARTPLPPPQRSYNRAITAQHPAAEPAIDTVTAWKVLTTRYRRAPHTINDTNQAASILILYKQFTE